MYVVFGVFLFDQTTKTKTTRLGQFKIDLDASYM